jgi:hypothetical protein
LPYKCILQRYTVVMVLTNIAASSLCMAIGIITPSNAVVGLYTLNSADP